MGRVLDDLYLFSTYRTGIIFDGWHISIHVDRADKRARYQPDFSVELVATAEGRETVSYIASARPCYWAVGLPDENGIAMSFEETINDSLTWAVDFGIHMLAGRMVSRYYKIALDSIDKIDKYTITRKNKYYDSGTIRDMKAISGASGIMVESWLDADISIIDFSALCRILPELIIKEWGPTQCIRWQYWTGGESFNG